MLTPLLFVIFAAGQSPPVSRDVPATARPTCAISGRITEQGSGRPVPRAIIRLATSNEHREAIADADGRYEFTDLKPGEYALWATAAELSATHLAQAYSETVPLTAFEEPQPNLGLKSGEVARDLNIALARALAIEGRILDSWDEPMADVEVNVSRLDGMPVAIMPATSDDRGEFRVYGLAPGRYRVCVEPGSRWGRAPEDMQRYVRTCHLAATSESMAGDVILESEDATRVDIRVQRRATYSISGSRAGAPLWYSTGTLHRLRRSRSHLDVSWCTQRHARTLSANVLSVGGERGAGRSGHDRAF